MESNENLVALNDQLKGFQNALQTADFDAEQFAQLQAQIAELQPKYEAALSEATLAKTFVEEAKNNLQIYTDQLGNARSQLEEQEFKTKELAKEKEILKSHLAEMSAKLDSLGNQRSFELHGILNTLADLQKRQDQISKLLRDPSIEKSKLIGFVAENQRGLNEVRSTLETMQKITPETKGGALKRITYSAFMGNKAQLPDPPNAGYITRVTNIQELPPTPVSQPNPPSRPKPLALTSPPLQTVNPNNNSALSKPQPFANQTQEFTERQLEQLRQGIFTVEEMRLIKALNKDVPLRRYYH